MNDPRSNEFTHPEGDESQSVDGEWRECPHCDGTGKQEGPGGWEECCHCRGKGERWFDFGDDLELEDGHDD